MRIHNYIREAIVDAAQSSFGKCEVILFGSRVDDAKRGGDFDIAIKTALNYEEFKKARIKFFKMLLLKELDVPIDLIYYPLASSDFKKEIDKGVKL